MTDLDSMRSMGRAIRRAVAVSLGLGIGVGIAVLAGGCTDRTYLTPTHGRAYHEVFAHQQTNPTPRRREARALEGMDSQEAAAVSQTYRRTLGTSNGEATSAPPMVLMSPQGAPAAPYMPPPSVP